MGRPTLFGTHDGHMPEDNRSAIEARHDEEVKPEEKVEEAKPEEIQPEPKEEKDADPPAEETAAAEPADPADDGDRAGA